MGPNDVDRSEIAFFDVETTVPTCPGQGCVILEFGCILICPRKLAELRSYSTLIRPSDLCLISTLPARRNGITRDAIVRGPCFSEVADEIYDLLHGRIWAGHNIVSFDCRRIQEAFAEIGRPAPEPKGTIDSLALLTWRFGRRAGNMKMASLATYFGLGQQTHRSLDDVRMNLEVLKYCSTVLFLESSLQQLQEGVAMEDELVSPDVVLEGCSSYTGFLDPEEVSIPSISACLFPVYRGIQRIRVLHSGLAFHLCSTRLKVRFGISTKYLDANGRPRFSIVVDATRALCQVLDTCDHLAEKLSIESGSSSGWRPVVSRKNGFLRSPTLRLNVPTVNSDSQRYETEMYRKESSGKQEKLEFSKCDAAEVAPLLNPGTLLDAYVSLDHYDYQKNAGIRLVAKKLVIHC